MNFKLTFKDYYGDRHTLRFLGESYENVLADLTKTYSVYKGNDDGTDFVPTFKRLSTSLNGQRPMLKRNY